LLKILIFYILEVAEIIRAFKKAKYRKNNFKVVKRVGRVVQDREFSKTRDPPGS